MQAERAKLLRFRRLERLREVERLAAARDVADHESTLAKIEALVRRSAMIAQTHSGGRQSVTGAELHSRAIFTNEISALACRAAQECDGAQISAHTARTHLASASHRRDRVTEHADAMSKKLMSARFAAHNPVLARKLKGGMGARG